MPRAGLNPVSVTEAGAALADEIGFAQLSMGMLAERLGVKTPSLYKHVDGLADLGYRIAVLAALELGDALSDATQGRAGGDALIAASHAMRLYARDHPGRYTAANAVQPTGTDDELARASRRMLNSFSAVLRGYNLDPSQEIHALRMLRSMMHGFAALEVGGGFRFDTAVDDSFVWMVDLIDGGLRAFRHSDNRTPAVSARRT